MSLLQISDPLKSNEELKKFVVGIDLGTTNSLIASYNKSLLFYTENNSEMIPSVVSVKPEDKYSVGFSAESIDNNDDSSIISSIKRLMGLSLSDIKLKSLDFEYKLQQSDTNMPSFTLYNKEYTAIDISSMILTHLRKLSEKEENKKLDGAVITVPAYFDDIQRQATKTAAQIAGINVLRLLNEPTAAALAYGLETKNNGNFIIYDFGGGTFDVSVLTLDKGVFKVLATDGDTTLGGDDIDYVISSWLVNKYKFLSDYPKNSVKKIARSLKENILDKDIAEYDFDTDKVQLTAEKFNELVKPIINKTLVILKNALKESNINKKDIDNIVLVGGSTRVSLVKKMLEEIIDCPVLNNIDPDKVVAHGAAVQASILSGNTKENILLLDVLPLSLGIETYGGLSEKIIPRNTPIPITSNKKFTTFKDGQSKLLIHIIQGERELVEDCKSLGKFTLTEIPSMISGVPRINVQFQIDTDGILSVIASEETSGKTSSIEVKPSYGLSESEITKMIQESNSNAQDDMVLRKLNESKVDGKRVIYALEQALEKDGDELLSNEEKKLIHDALTELKSIIDSKNSEIIISTIENVEKTCEFYVERRMNRSINSMIAGKGIDDIL